MLALAATNAVAVVLFAAVYALAGARWLSQPAFIACLAVLFVLVTTLWVRTERRQGAGRGAIARFGRMAFGVVVVAIVVPMILLMPLFWLESQLPAEAGLAPVLAPVMTIVLIALGLMVLVNVLGAVVVTALGARGTRR